jgi:hypothetical protein
VSEAGLARLRATLGWLAAAFCLCAGLALVDSFIDSARTGPNSFSLLPGGTEHLSGPLPQGVGDAASLRVASDHPGLTLAVVTQKQGFWFGNPMWLATVAAASDAAPGLYSVTVYAPERAGAAPVQAFFIQVFPDKDAQDAASHSRIRQLFGVPPLAAAGASAFCAVLAGLGVYFASRRLEALWGLAGKAVVYMCKKTPDGQLISFGLGTDHGLAPGASVAVRDASGLPVATATVVRCGAADAAALVAGENRVALGSIVSRAPGKTFA